MNRTRVETTRAPAKRDILFTTNPVVAIGVIVVPTGLTADEEGVRRIKAGTPLIPVSGAMTGVYTNRSTRLRTVVGTSFSNDPAPGVTQHDIVFQRGDTQANANLIILGFIDIDKMEPGVFESLGQWATPDATAKVIYLRGGVQTTE